MKAAPERTAWLDAAARFYDEESIGKALPARHRLFSESYRPVHERLGLGPGSVILDAGCGCGELAGALQGRVAKVVGVDLSPASLRQAKVFHPEACVLKADIQRLPLADDAFDAVAAFTSVEFCEDKQAVLRELGRVLKPGGKIYLDVRNSGFLPFRLLKPLLPALAAIGIVEPYPADGFRDLSAREWKAEIASAGFRLLSVHRSLWPWNFGGFATRGKNAIIQAAKLCLPIDAQYMVGLLAEKPR